jgi:Cu/Ag efflux protein CusF
VYEVIQSCEATIAVIVVSMDTLVALGLAHRDFHSSTFKKSLENVEYADCVKKIAKNSGTILRTHGRIAS